MTNLIQVLRRGPRRRTSVVVGVFLTTVVALGACASDPNSIAAQAQAGDRKGYLSGDGSVEQIPVNRRGEALKLSGTTLEGAAWALTSVPANRVVVVNVWGSWCGPCVAEAPDLQKAWSTFQTKGTAVQFIGLDFKEGADSGRAFQRRYGITYPSLTFDGGTPVQALQGQAPAVPTTLVLDGSRRIAARVLGKTDAPTLAALVADVLRESPSTPTGHS